MDQPKTEGALSAKEIFFNALDRSIPAERASYLDAACRGNAELRRHVDALLAVHDQPDSRLDAGASGSAWRSLVEERVGGTVGRYKLLEEIGDGGMGVVFVAEQTEPIRRRVALKVIKPGMDTKRVIARFEAERQALAVMDHPNIAKVFDAGATSSGRPYFVMELVHGPPITKYCDDHRLSLRDRLELMIPVCQAVQHAHQQGIIHRDIKPNNVLVTRYDGRPVPKVIDFGVAKATAHRIAERTTFTEAGQIIGTLEYMSPEQADSKQLEIDARSDVYSLGALLYELLAGSPPHDSQRLNSAAYDEIVRIIREESPSRPSAKLGKSGALASIAANRQLEPARLRELVRGELDWIVMKSLEKDRSRRYESASVLAADVQRHLNGQRVLAKPPRLRLRRWVAQRNWNVALGLAAVLLVAAIAALWRKGNDLNLPRAAPLAAFSAPSGHFVDPRHFILSATTQFGSPGEDFGNDVAADPFGDIAVVGETTGALPEQATAGGIDVFLRKFDSRGVVLWTRQFGSSGDDYGQGVAADAAGNWYACGTTTGSLPGQTSSGGRDAFIRKYDARGAVLWTRQFGSAGDEHGERVAADSAGDVYVVGATRGALPGQSSAGGTDAFICKFAPNGAVVWTRQFGGLEFSDDHGSDVASDPAGNVWVVGSTDGSLAGLARTGEIDAYVRKYAATGELLWTSQFGAAENAFARGVTTDAAGNAYVVGELNGVLPGQSGFGGLDAFVRKYDAGGAQLWSVQFGSQRAERCQDVATDKSGNVFVCGITLDTLPGQASSGGQDVYLRKYAGNGDLEWTNQFGAASHDDRARVAIDAAGRVYLSGGTYGALPGQSNAGDHDAFVTQFTEAPSPPSSSANTSR